MRFLQSALLLLAALMLIAATDNPFAIAARELDATIAREYAYLDKLPGAALPDSEKLGAERDAVHDQRSLLRYAERRITSLADHHVVAGSSFADSWALVPTYTDLWIVNRKDQYLIDAVRENSPAARANIRAGQRLLAVGGIPIEEAVAQFWKDLGLAATPRRAAYAAQVLVAGRRDRDRSLTISGSDGAERRIVLPSLYKERSSRPPLDVRTHGATTTIRFNNSLGDEATIGAFDGAMRQIAATHRLVIDLRDTPSGGNTTVARAIMGWFVTEPQGYQIHNRPVEERETGIARQWVEQVLPRGGKHRSSLPTILVGRWTGSMGEGLAAGFSSMGATVCGSPMAGLNGSVEDFQIGQTDLTIKLPTERLLTTGGLPREELVPELCDEAKDSAQI